MEILSWNVNGLRAVEKKGNLKEVLEKYSPSLFFIQEIKGQEEKFSSINKKYPGYKKIYHPAEKPGYAGVALWIKEGDFPEGSYQVEKGFPGWIDYEGRVLQFFWKDWVFLGVYVPNGGKSKEAFEEKLLFLEKFLEYLLSLRKKKKKVLFCGDMNIAHQEIDLARPKENQNSIGFLPVEREWISTYIKKGFVDLFRHFYPDRVSYTWWHLKTRARERNVGWRIDYFFIDKKHLSYVKEVEHLEEIFGSDHCPIWLKIEV